MQDKEYFLFDEPQRFRLRPDIVVRRNKEGNDCLLIMDTKWKKLKLDSGANYGISQADIYQMYAYSKKFTHQIYGYYIRITQILRNLISAYLRP